MGKKIIHYRNERKRISHAHYVLLLLLIDGFGIHNSDEFQEILEEENIHLILFALRHSYQTQFPNLFITALQKRDHKNN